MRAWMLTIFSLVACSTAELPPLPDARDAQDAQDAKDTQSAGDATASTDGQVASDVDDVGSDAVTAPDGDATDGSSDGDDGLIGDGWHTVLSGLPEGIYDVWGGGPDDLWLVGAGGLAVHGGADGWRQLDLRAVDGSGAALRGVYGPDLDEVWLVGDQGRAFRWARAGGAAERVTTGTDATLYAVWGASADEVWAVGGYAFPDSGPPVIVKLGRSGVALATLPAGLPSDAALLDVWGASASDVWAVGEQGMVLHYDGDAWSTVAIGRTDRLAGVHGAAGEVVLAGGTTQALILSKAAAASTFEAAAIETAPVLNGLAVGPGGAAWAVGSLGQTFVRAAGQAGWTSQSQAAGSYWNDAWIDARGDAWLVGEGIVARFGPDRGDLPTGALVRLDAPDPEAEDDVEVVDDVADTSAPDDSADSADAASDASLNQDDWPFKLGQAPIDNPTALVPFVSGQDVTITHGPQGGMHVEVIVRFPWTTTDTSVVTGIHLYLSIDGVRKALYETDGYPLPSIGNGLFQTYVLPVQFECSLVPPLCSGSDLAGHTATLSATIAPPGQSWTGSIDFVLRDSF